jgi:hypothetical protein
MRREDENGGNGGNVEPRCLQVLTRCRRMIDCESQSEMLQMSEAGFASDHTPSRVKAVERPHVVKDVAPLIPANRTHPKRHG